MSKQLTAKLSALAFALFVNSLMIGGVAYLFSAKANASTVCQGAPTTAEPQIQKTTVLVQSAPRCLAKA